MIKNIEKRICAWKTNVNFQYNSLSEEDRKKFEQSPQFYQYDKCLKCLGYDDNCSKYRDLKKIGMV